MTVYIVQLVSGKERGGLCGPFASLKNCLAFFPSGSHRPNHIRIVSCNEQDGSEKILYTWDWILQEWKSSNEKKTSIEFGIMAPPIAEQLENIDRQIDSDVVDQWQKDADAITRLLTRGLINKADAQYARRKLESNIEESEG